MLGALTDATHLVIKGRVGTLKIMGVNGRSVLDASGLKAKRIVFAGEVNGGSTVSLCAPNGSIRFEAGVNGHSNLHLDAPGGVVTFVGGENGAINGESHLWITSRRVDFQSPINGTQTSIDVTLTSGGQITFHSLRGASRLSYRESNLTDPEPTIEAGSRAPAATVYALLRMYVASESVTAVQLDTDTGGSSI